MYLPNCKVIFEGLQVAIEKRNIIDNMMESLQCRVPYDARMKLLIRKTETAVTGQLSICSGPLNFSFAHNAFDSLAVMKRLSEDMNDEIQAWSVSRTF